MGNPEGKPVPLSHVLLLPRRRQRVARCSLAAALVALAVAHLLARFTATRCWSIDWARPAVAEYSWRTVPRRTFAHARFDELMREYTKTPVLIANAMDGWPAIAEWTPASLRARYGNKTVEVYFWGESGLDWRARTEIETMTLAEFVDGAMGDGPMRSGSHARLGYVQESSFLEDSGTADGATASGDEVDEDDEGDERDAAPHVRATSGLPAAASAPRPAPSILREARRRVRTLVPPSKARAWRDMLWFPHTPLPADAVASLESAFWMGAGGVGTGIHYDASPAFLHQVHGVKRVVLWPPSARSRLCISSKYNYGAELSEIDARPFLDGRAAAEPGDELGAASAERESEAQRGARRAKAIAQCPAFAALPNATVDLRPGETLAIPPGWYHATLTMSASISVAVRVQSACQRRADWFDDVLLWLHNAGLYKRGNCVCHHEPSVV